MEREEKSMDCEEKARLVGDYEQKTARFSHAVTVRQSKMATSLKEEYDRLQRFVDQARVESEGARLALERHVSEHGC